MKDFFPCTPSTIVKYMYSTFKHSETLNLQLSTLGEKQFENPQTGNLNKIMKDCVLVKECLRDLNKPETEQTDEQQPERKKKSFVCVFFLHINNLLAKWRLDAWDIQELKHF